MDARAAACAALLLLLTLAACAAPADRPAVAAWGGGGGANPAPIRGFSGVIPAREDGLFPRGAARTRFAVAGSSGFDGAAYHADSQLVESALGGDVRFYRRAVTGGHMDYVVVRLTERVHVEPIHADGAAPANDATGDTVWADGGAHLASVPAMVAAPYAARDGLTLLAALAFDYHGARTSPEGTVVVNHQVLRVNPWRGIVCIRDDRTVAIGVMTPTALVQCAQAFGAGPVILWNSKVARVDAASENGEAVPFNVLMEDFAQLDDRIMFYNGTWPITVIGAGRVPDGASFLVLVAAYNLPGPVVAEHLRRMGCSEALNGDGDTSTQMVWRGALTQNRPPRPVPQAVAVYGRDASAP